MAANKRGTPAAQQHWQSAPETPGQRAARGGSEQESDWLREENRRLQEHNARLSERLALLERVLDGSEQGFWDWDLREQKFVVSERFESMLGFTLGERDLSPENWAKLVHPDDLVRAQDSIARHLSGHSPLHEVELRALTKFGEWKHILTRGKIVSRDADGNPVLMSGTHTDITERKALLERLECLAHQDSLTGLYNRGRFQELAEWELKKAWRYRKDVALLMLDIDGFKKINDRFGHDGGDAVLRRLAEILRTALRQVDVIGRFGGDEFVVLLPETSPDEALVTAQRLHDAIRRAVAASGNGNPRSFTVSIGVGFGASAMMLSSLITRADEALYRAKRAGRDRICAAELGPDVAEAFYERGRIGPA